MKIENVETFIVANPPPYYGGRYFIFIKLTSNNIINIHEEWPLPQAGWDAYLLEKYGNNYDTLYNGVHHYESNEVKNSRDVVIFPKGLTVGVGQSVSYYDQWINQQVTVNPVSQPVTNYEYEDRLNAQKRGIFVLKGLYLNIVFDDIEKMMGYKKGSTNFISRTLKRADNIRLYD